jgi:ketosteroid isomerase-like protein
MRLKYLGFGALAALLLLPMPLSALEPAPKPVEDIGIAPSARGAAAAVDAFHAALKRGDTSAAAALLSEDALVFEQGGAERTKAEYAAQHLPADAEFAKAVASTLTRRAGRSDGQFAWIASEGRTTGTFKGRPIDSVTTETMVLRRARRGWEIVHIHWSSAARR